MHHASSIVDLFPIVDVDELSLRLCSDSFFVTESFGKWRKVFGKSRKVTECRGKWRKVAESDGKWRKVGGK